MPCIEAPRTVFIQTSAVKSVENWGQVRQQLGQREANGKHCPHTVCREWLRCRSTSSVRRRHLRLELLTKKHISRVTTVYLLSPSMFETVRHVIGEGQAPADPGFCHQSTRLLQLYTGRTAQVEYHTIVTGVKCRRKADPCFWSTWPRDINVNCLAYTAYSCPWSGAYNFLTMCSLMHLFNTGHGPQYLREHVARLTSGGFSGRGGISYSLPFSKQGAV